MTKCFPHRPPKRLLVGCVVALTISCSSDHDPPLSEAPLSEDKTIDESEHVADVDESSTSGDAASEAPQQNSVEESPTQSAKSTQTRKQAAPDPALLDIPDEVYVPNVKLSHAHDATCRIRVGDRVPDVTLASGGGLRDSLKSSRLTVLVFWSQQSVYAAEQNARLRHEISQAFGAAGVQAIAIHVGAERSADLERPLVLSFSDPDRSIFAQFATEILPRTYIINRDGKVLWLDIEYSRGMRQELRNALAFYLRSDS